MNLTDNQREVLESMDPESWQRPMDVGGRDASHHSHTLVALAKKGLVDRSVRASGMRGSYLYRIKPEGVKLLREIREKEWGDRDGS